MPNWRSDTSVPSRAGGSHLGELPERLDPAVLCALLHFAPPTAFAAIRMRPLLQARAERKDLRIEQKSGKTGKDIVHDYALFRQQGFVIKEALLKK